MRQAITDDHTINYKLGVLVCACEYVYRYLAFGIRYILSFKNEKPQLCLTDVFVNGKFCGNSTTAIKQTHSERNKKNRMRTIDVVHCT